MDIWIHGHSRARSIDQVGGTRIETTVLGDHRGLGRKPQVLRPSASSLDRLRSRAPSWPLTGAAARGHYGRHSSAQMTAFSLGNLGPQTNHGPSPTNPRYPREQRFLLQPRESRDYAACASPWDDRGSVLSDHVASQASAQSRHTFIGSAPPYSVTIHSHTAPKGGGAVHGMHGTSHPTLNKTASHEGFTCNAVRSRALPDGKMPPESRSSPSTPPPAASSSCPIITAAKTSS